MNSSDTLAVLNTAKQWSGIHSIMPGLRFVHDRWCYFHEDLDDDTCFLDMYTEVEKDILDEWSLTYPDKPLPLAGIDGHVIRDPGILLLQAESSYTIRVYFFDEENDAKIHARGFYRKPVSILMHSLRTRIKWVIIFTSWHTRTLKTTYAPSGVGYKRAYEEFHNIQTSQVPV